MRRIDGSSDTMGGYQTVEDGYLHSCTKSQERIDLEGVNRCLV